MKTMISWCLFLLPLRPLRFIWVVVYFSTLKRFGVLSDSRLSTIKAKVKPFEPKLNPRAALIAGPFDQYPTGLGFSYFYGFIAGETSQYEPRLYENTNPIEPPYTPEEGYHLTEDMVTMRKICGSWESVVGPQKHGSK